jgi:hypothetical protein
MKKLALALMLSLLGMVAGSAAQAASLTNKSYTTARKAAVGGAAYHWNKAVGWGRYHSTDVKITKVVKDSGTVQKFRVEARDGSRSKLQSVRKDGARKFRAYIPNRYVYTPPSAGR